MSLQPSVPDAQPLTDYIEEGARIAAILLVWGIIGAAVGWVTTDLVRIGTLFDAISLSGVFVLAGFLNAVLYVCYRAIDYWAVQ